MASVVGSLCETRVVTGDLFGDDALGGLGFPAPHGLVLCGDLLQVVDVVDEAAFEAVDLRRNVAGDGDVDEEGRGRLRRRWQKHAGRPPDGRHGERHGRPLRCW